jgi:hypothetical protein
LHLTLYYRGPLKARGSREHKHEIRRAFHRQLCERWKNPPLRELRRYLLNEPTILILDTPSLVREIGGFRFVPLVAESFAAVAELNLHLLRPGPLGEILSQGGDIDNRLKTLFDALAVPQKNMLPDDAAPLPNEQPFYCLLDDDRLISAVRVETAQLLEPVTDDSEVVLFVQVVTRVAYDNGHNYWLS